MSFRGNIPKTRCPITDEQFTAICERLAAGESLRSICREQGQPDLNVFLRDVGPDGNMLRAKAYNLARQEQAEAFAAKIIEAAEAEPLRSGPYDSIDQGDVANRRLKIDAYKWTAAKLKPKVYGDKPPEVAVGNISFVINAPSPLKSVDEWTEVVEKLEAQAPEEPKP